MCCKSQDLCTPGCISQSCCHRPTPLLSVPHLVAYQLNSWFHRQSCEAWLSCELSFCSRLNHCSTDGIYNILSVRGTCLRVRHAYRPHLAIEWEPMVVAVDLVPLETRSLKLETIF